jgi:glycosyltransferase involved in cell wall biosynthesis
MARNSGIAWSSEPYLFMLDADNRLRPPALSRLLEALQCSGAAFAYSQLCWFGEEDGIGIADVWEPERLAINNYIDAMALIRRDALLSVGGYAVLADDHGLEDYDLWCRFAELGLDGVFVPELICEYRVHAASMVRTRSIPNILALNAELALRHPSIFYPRGDQSAEARRAAEGAGSAGQPG